MMPIRMTRYTLLQDIETSSRQAADPSPCWQGSYQYRMSVPIDLRNISWSLLAVGVRPRTGPSSIAADPGCCGQEDKTLGPDSG